MSIIHSTNINSLEYKTAFTGELDKILMQKSVTGFLSDNALRAKFVDSRSVKIPNIELSGLGSYDRDTGFTKGAVTITNQIFTMEQDRSRTFFLDSQDLDETGVIGLSSEVLGEFVRTKAVPEKDAYVLSKIASTAANRGQQVTTDLAKPYAAFNECVAGAQAAAGFDEELVCFVNQKFWTALKNSSEIDKSIDVATFKAGGVEQTVKSIDGVPILPLANYNMQTAYTYLTGAAGANFDGGYQLIQSGKGVYCIVMPKKGASVITKHEKIRVFAPDENPDADAYKFDYRLYYDVFVKNSYLPTIYVSIAPGVTISSDVSSAVSKTAGSISGTLSVTAAASDSSTLTYQWYKSNDAYKQKIEPVAGATAHNWTIDTTLTAGTYYYFVRICAGGATLVDSTVCTLTVS